MTEYYVYVIYREKWIDYIGFGAVDRVLRQRRKNPNGRVAVVYNSTDRRDAFEYEQNLIKKHMPTGNSLVVNVPQREVNLKEIDVTLVPTRRYSTANISNDLHSEWKNFCRRNGLVMGKAMNELLMCAVNGMHGSFMEPFLVRKEEGKK
jgi:hypothetical protein